MSEIYFSSDLHFGHSKILDFCRNTRLGSTIEEHDELLIEAINKTVTPRDTLYLLGDISWHPAHITKELLQRLNSHKILILGNHDQQITKNNFSGIFENISQYEEIKINKTDIIMFHYPISQWNKCHYGSIHLHGHTHGSFIGDGKILDVGVDGPLTKNMEPVNISTIFDYVKNKPITTH